MGYDELLKLLKVRRSIRRFTPEPVPDDYLEKIIEAARWAPSAFNTQPWEFVIIKDQELKDKIVHFIAESGPQFRKLETAREEWQVKHRPRKKDSGLDFRSAPVYILLLGDTRAKLGLPMGIRYNPDMCRSLFTSSLASAFLNMHMAATSLGLASQWVSHVQSTYVHCLIKDLLGIPLEMEAYDMMALGYPATKPSAKYLRQKEEMVHYDYCGEGDFRSDDEVKDFLNRTRSWTLGQAHREPKEDSE